jgi:hypothetical protein
MVTLRAFPPLEIYGQWLIADFPLQKPIPSTGFLLKTFSDSFLTGIQEKDLPLTVAGQQWFFTIFPSEMKRD